jgi:hypothetical protein
MLVGLAKIAAASLEKVGFLLYAAGGFFSSSSSLNCCADSSSVRIFAGAVLFLIASSYLFRKIVSAALCDFCCNHEMLLVESI